MKLHLPLDWQQIDTVFLDMDGTLLDLYFDNYFWQEFLPRYWGELHAIDEKEAKRRLLPRMEIIEGTLSWYCLDYWAEELGVNILKLKSKVEHLIDIRPHAKEFLELLVQIGKKPVMVTNAHPGLISMKLGKTGIGKFFDQIICAHDHGFPKEEESFWASLDDKIPFSTTRTVLIDDNMKVLRAARNYGITNVFGIAQPDSHAPLRSSDEFVLIGDFRELFPESQYKIIDSII